jgi:hypothetical protein
MVTQPYMGAIANPKGTLLCVAQQLILLQDKQSSRDPQQSCASRNNLR